MIKKTIRFFNTVSHLKVSQAYNRVSKYFIKNKYKNIVYSGKSKNIRLKDNIKSNNSLKFKNFCFDFLNLNKKFSDEIDWNYQEHGKLWVYNLNYFDFLNQENLSSEEGTILIDHYIQNLEYIRDGMDPYPVSLRLINWIKFLSKNNIVNKQYDNVIYSHAVYLSKNLEFHLLGNHILENAFAMLSAALYFSNHKFYISAKRILEKELEEQVLDDGGHFELSPMYHSIILYRVLNAIDIYTNNNFTDLDLLKLLKQKAKLMLSWLKTITLKNGDLPLFNDSINNIAPTPYALFEYAKILNLVYGESCLSDSGYNKISEKNIEAIVKGGAIGAGYIPGHAHADTFSFILYINKSPFIIDTGVSTYENNKLRSYQRSTSAHNTVTVNNGNSSDVWSAFRVGKRADAEVVKHTEKAFHLKHYGYSKPHYRSFDYSATAIIISDKTNKTNSIAYLHFDPSISVTNKDNSIFSEFARIDFKNADSVELQDCHIAKEFNQLILTKKAVIRFKNNLETKISVNVKNN